MSLALSFNGSQQSEGSVIQSDLGPALAGNPGQELYELYQVWKGSHGDTQIYFSSKRNDFFRIWILYPSFR